METKKRTITLTDRAPVKIQEEEWPIIAHGHHKDFDGQYEFQSNRTTELNIRVRRHEDGRVIVYGVYSYSTNWQGENGHTARTGYVIDDRETLIESIKQVGSDLETRGVDNEVVRIVVDACIADLPAEDL